jgi:hypothetical protein
MKTGSSLIQAFLLGVALFALPAAVHAQFNFTTNIDGSLNISNYTGSGGVVIIPNTTNGLPITSIGFQAFYHATSVTGVTIGTNVTSIGSEAFQLCTNLASVTIGIHVTSIGSQAFYDCNNLTGVSIPGSVTSIGAYAFAGCTSLTAIAVVPSNPDFTNVDGALFNQNQTTLIEYPGGLAGAYTVPGSVTSIGVGAFWDCTSLTSVTIPGNVTSIEADAFPYCRSLTNVLIGSGVASIGQEAFADCGSLPSIMIPSSVTSIGEASFTGCTSLTNIAVNTSNPDFSSVNGVLFNQNQSTLLAYPGGLTGAYTISNSVTSIGTYAFGDCIGLTSIYVPSSVTSVGNYVFEECSGLKGAYFQGNAPTPGADVFIDANATAKVYYFSGTTGWNTTYGGLPTVKLNSPQITGVGVQNNELGLTVAGTNTQVFVVEACTNLVNANWQPIQTDTLTGASFNFTDLQWTNFPIRFYRLSAP